MDALRFFIESTGETLLLVAVSAEENKPGAWPCRVVGTFSPGTLPTPPADDALRISRLLTEIGVPGNLLGCAYLRTALALLLREPALSRTLNRSLYPRVADQHATTAACVERAIRHAITQTFSRGSDGYRAALGRLASSVGDNPTNAEFLAQTAECLRLGA